MSGDFDEDDMQQWFEAATEGDNGVLDELIQEGMKVNEKDAKGNTALHLTCSAGKILTANFLVAAGADLNAVNSDGDTPLILASRKGQKDCVNILVGYKAKLDIVNAKGDSALHVACDCWHSKQEKCPHVECVQWLLRGGADGNIKNKAGDCPLHLAVSVEAINLINVLLNTKVKDMKQAPDPLAFNTSNKTPMELAENDEVRAAIAEALRTRMAQRTEVVVEKEKPKAQVEMPYNAERMLELEQECNQLRTRLEKATVAAYDAAKQNLLEKENAVLREKIKLYEDDADPSKPKGPKADEVELERLRHKSQTDDMELERLRAENKDLKEKTGDGRDLVKEIRDLEMKLKLVESNIVGERGARSFLEIKHENEILMRENLELARQIGPLKMKIDGKETPPPTLTTLQKENAELTRRLEGFEEERNAKIKEANDKVNAILDEKKELEDVIKNMKSEMSMLRVENKKATIKK